MELRDELEQSVHSTLDQSHLKFTPKSAANYHRIKEPILPHVSSAMGTTQPVE